jgi:hypothetical protein
MFWLSVFVTIVLGRFAREAAAAHQAAEAEVAEAVAEPDVPLDPLPQPQ